MKKTILICIYSFLMISASSGQVIDFTAPVTFQFSGEPLQKVLDEIEKRYGITFSYSRDLIPLDQKMYADIHEQECKEALEKLFEQTQVVYGVIGNQIVLGIDTQKVAIIPDQGDIQYGGLEDAWVSNEMMIQTTQFRQLYELPALPKQEHLWRIHEPIRRYLIEMEPGDITSNDHNSIFDHIERMETSPVFHASVFSPLGFRTTTDLERPTNIGLHLTWGLDPSVDGVIFSGLGNTVEGEMNGIQFSGLFNTVGSRMSGAQFSGLLNVNIENTYGFSGAGVANYSRRLSGAQFAGVMNITTGMSTGFQGAGVLNVAADGYQVSQIAGVGNFAGQESGIQIAGVLNIGDHVRTGQIGGILNIARKVDGFQIGLFNFADTVKGPAIGLLSFVRKGYHSIEFGAQESIHANAMMRIGTKRFYNILRLGARVDEETWGLGYGIGTSIPLGKRNSFQIEVMSTHVNENEFWTDQLNLLNQLNLAANIKIGQHVSLAIGPVVNVSVSKVYHADIDQYGMQLGSNHIFDETSYPSGSKPVNVKGWFGFHAGLRFESR